jgi:hypothetical protein
VPRNRGTRGIQDICVEQAAAAGPGRAWRTGGERGAGGWGGASARVRRRGRAPRRRLGGRGARSPRPQSGAGRRSGDRRGSRSNTRRRSVAQGQRRGTGAAAAPRVDRRRLRHDGQSPASVRDEKPVRSFRRPCASRARRSQQNCAGFRTSFSAETSNVTMMSGSSKSCAPRYTNSTPRVVFPVPGDPVTITTLPRGSPPSRMSSARFISRAGPTASIRCDDRSRVQDHLVAVDREYVESHEARHAAPTVSRLQHRLDTV